MHSQCHGQLGLDSGPRGLNPEKLRGFRIAVPSARASLLSMNGILWKDDGCATQSDEVAHLEISTDSNRDTSSRDSESEFSPPIQDTARILESRYGEEDASDTTLHEEPPGLVDGSLREPALFFHPLLYPSTMLDPLPDMSAMMDLDGMNAGWVDPQTVTSTFFV